MDSTNEDVRLRLFDDPIVHRGGDDAAQELEATVDALRRQLAEQARRIDQLELSEGQFRQLVDTLPQIVWITEPDGRHVHFNRNWLEFTGLSLEESRGDGWNFAFHPDDRGLAMVLWAEATRTGQPYEIEYRLRRADGSYRWMLGRAAPLHDADGEVVQWFGTCTDIEDVKRAHRRIDEQARLLDQTQDAIMVHDRDHHVSYWNRAAERIHGWPRSEALGRRLDELVSPDLEQVEAAWEVLLRTGEWSGDLRYVTRTGRELFLEGRWTLLRYTDGTPRAALAVNTDVTQRRLIESRYLAALEARATQDALTGLPNRAALFDQLDLLLGQRQRTGIAVAFIDLDDFKPINDRFGHRRGDEVLAHVAEQLRATIRQGDLVARIGGDEFVVIGEADSADTAARLGERIDAALRGEVVLGEATVTLSASVGMAFVGPDERPDADDLLSRADAAMYEVKRDR
ncbi:MAG: diguanylate cyclase [Actinobacteria bacterium]|jgi:diguanylate cyclase (GGDEF)-like protein/PAS domain S-box-containing protein|nr:diguanylate cyclase [Actinomycetota bacterium]